ncbi:MAG: right-handed parallel beta-helix repeat-containing protein [Gammaproteobacteria bacterium]
MKQQHFVKKTAALTLALGALAEPAWAVTNITQCQTITKPGSYKLTKNLTAPGTCLSIKASQVTLDLNGYTLSGNGKGVGVIDASGQIGDQTEITVRNGAIIGFNFGVGLGSTQNAVVEGLEVGRNAGGIFLLTGRAEANTVHDNAGKGIEGFEGITAKNNLVLDNQGNGISGGPGSILTDNLVAGNGNGIAARGNAPAPFPRATPSCVATWRRTIKVRGYPWPVPHS